MTFLSPGAKPNSSMVNGAGNVGSKTEGGVTAISPKPFGRGIGGTGVLIPLGIPIFRLRLASMIRNVSA